VASIIDRGNRGSQIAGRATLGLSAVILVLAAAGARADSLDEGKRLYHELDYPAARAALLRAVDDPDPHRRAQGYLYLALIDTIEGQDDDARQAFSFGLALDPGLELPFGTSPKIAKRFEDAKAELARTGPKPPPPPPPAEWSSAPVSPAAAVTPKATPEPPHRLRWLAGAMIALGVIVAASGVYFGVQEQAAEKSFKSAKWQTDAVKDLSAANQNAVNADVLYGIGGAAGIAGAALVFTF
jgi:hypothetical protein